MVERVATVETEVTRQLKTTLQLLQELTAKQDKHTAGIEELMGGQHDLESKMGDITERVEKLEMKSVQSTTATEHGDGLGGRRVPALIVGGWNDDTAVRDVLEKAQQALRLLKVDIDYQDMFVPGVRRGFGLIPLKGPRAGESDEGHRQRIQEAITKVRNAKMQTERVREDTGQPRYMFLAISQPPERRRRAKLAAKVKRCILELGGEHAHLEAELRQGLCGTRGSVCRRQLAQRKRGRPRQDRMGRRQSNGQGAQDPSGQGATAASLR